MVTQIQTHFYTKKHTCGLSNALIPMCVTSVHHVAACEVESTLTLVKYVCVYLCYYMHVLLYACVSTPILVTYVCVYLCYCIHAYPRCPWSRMYAWLINFDMSTKFLWFFLLLPCAALCMHMHMYACRCGSIFAREEGTWYQHVSILTWTYMWNLYTHIKVRTKSKTTHIYTYRQTYTHVHVFSYPDTGSHFQIYLTHKSAFWLRI